MHRATSRVVLSMAESLDLGGHNGKDSNNDEIYHHVCKLQTLKNYFG